MTRLKQVFGIIISFFVFWFSMLGVQMFAEFLDIESLKFVAGKTEAARTFYSPYPFLIVFLITLLSLYFLVIKLGKPKKEKLPALEEKKEELQ
ncbi:MULTISPECIES: DUF3935 domain-containing protein [Bacillus]|jgi:large-conductance mechanosensitive channel|uniref:DUF3935 domain-containing protein n=2 Tax=Bacillus toyonensis TaxID=155322 RepID=A0A2C4XL86_9BACI|nr:MULTISPECIES: DUF3935 domain-containing protein [Bacillus]EEL20113.1 hypothetical protein bcere0017_50840 [Bacillus cereus Rock1-3]EJR58713.1 hypothetical protein IIO_04301 [Bacillus cereus VD115]KAB0444985.1 DUF3935 domain-containing protein [Lysinibacillus sp. VIA-II-2016]KNH40977.1 hypothetical protein ACS75_09035 [Bacillus thuringiensis]KXY17369.1 hypothetical protein AT259_04390 [Bacillus cereus]MDH8707466.1 large-conductance mechanosensitive channel [Stenotrophomonas sp. 1198]OTX040